MGSIQALSSSPCKGLSLAGVAGSLKSNSEHAIKMVATTVVRVNPFTWSTDWMSQVQVPAGLQMPILVEFFFLAKCEHVFRC